MKWVSRDFGFVKSKNEVKGFIKKTRAWDWEKSGFYREREEETFWCSIVNMNDTDRETQKDKTKGKDQREASKREEDRREEDVFLLFFLSFISFFFPILFLMGIGFK